MIKLMKTNENTKHNAFLILKIFAGARVQQWINIAQIEQ